MEVNTTPQQWLDIWVKEIFSLLRHKGKKELTDKIRLKKILFQNYISPIFTIIKIESKHIVVVDVELLQKIYYKKTKEIFAMLLHELGHIFNVPKKEDVPVNNFQDIYDEYYADDFVRKLSFEEELLASLETYRDWKIKNKLQDNLLSLRIDRIRRGDPIKEGKEID